MFCSVKIYIHLPQVPWWSLPDGTEAAGGSVICSKLNLPKPYDPFVVYIGVMINIENQLNLSIYLHLPYKIN